MDIILKLPTPIPGAATALTTAFSGGATGPAPNSPSLATATLSHTSTTSKHMGIYGERRIIRIKSLWQTFSIIKVRHNVPFIGLTVFLSLSTLQLNY